MIWENNTGRLRASCITFGCYQVIISDQGREPVHKVKEELFYHTHHNISSAYHPPTNDLTEASLIKVVNSSQDNWDEHLSAVLFAYQTGVQKATHFEIISFGLTFKALTT